MKKIFSFLKKSLLPAFIISALVLVVVSPLGCRATVEGMRLLEGDFTVPKIVSVEIDDSQSIILSCSKEVRVEEAVVINAEDRNEVMSLSPGEAFVPGNSPFRLEFPSQTKIGGSYEIEGILEDKNGNTLMFNIPFIGFNERVPSLIFSEVRNASDSKKKMHEFVEFYSLTDGNLAGLEFVSAYDGEQKKYSFPSIEISSGEFITLHLRKPVNEDGTYVEEGMIDELGSDLNLSFATDSSSSARDLWVENTSARISPSDILVLRNAANGKILDAFLFAESKTVSWNKKYAELQETVFQSGVWRNSEGNASSEIESAFCSDGMTTVTRSMSRQNISSLVFDSYSSRASDWILTGSKGGRTNESTPGLPNSSMMYVK